ncbi:MAG: hypothetical protein HOI21_00480 [Bacteroidetes Order II. Incertae sedis bacterium]|jgi:hypothetical protein|nr:hypothetical protein [Bacteroidetes Order II. bacterium]
MPHGPGNIGHDTETVEKIASLGARWATIVEFYVESDAGEVVIQKVRQERAVKLQQIPVGPAAEDRKLFWANRDYQEDVALTFQFPYGPKDIKYGANALEYSEVMRPSRKPLLRSKFPKNRTVSLNAVIAHRASHGFLPCEDQLAILYSMAAQDKDLIFSHGGIALPFHVRMTSLNVTARRRNESGLITQAKIDITLKESISINQQIVFLTAVPHEPAIVNEPPPGPVALTGAEMRSFGEGSDAQLAEDVATEDGDHATGLVYSVSLAEFIDGGGLSAGGYRRPVPAELTTDRYHDPIL